MKRYVGEIFWLRWEPKSKIVLEGMDAKINRAILNNNILKMDLHDRANKHLGEISLRSKDSFKFDGSAKYINNMKSSAKVNMRYYLNKENALLIGNWVEDKIEFSCIIELVEVEEFKN